MLGDSQLSSAARNAIVEPTNAKWVSPVSYWEIAIKMSIGKFKPNRPFEDLIQQGIVDNRFSILAIATQHAGRVLQLPFHHRDPFDRMIIAQALVERMHVVSADSDFDAYGVRRIR